MPTVHTFKVAPRPFTRREKTIIRQDVKRFQKIGRDHGCTLLEDYAEFVSERLRRDDEGNLTAKSFELVRGLGAHFGDLLLDYTPMTRVTGDLDVTYLSATEAKNIVDKHPGWLMVDQWTTQSVLIPFVIADRLLVSNYWAASLDDIFDEIVDWNQGYLTKDDLRTAWALGPDLEDADFWAA